MADPISDLLERTEARRVASLGQLSEAHRAKFGQYFTPRLAADLIASMVELPTSGRVRVLDPGAGSGSLTAALAARAFREAPTLELQLIAQELDSSVVATLGDTLRDIVRTGEELGCVVSTELIEGDYIEDGDRIDDIDVVVMNPPYAKIPANSRHRRTMDRRGVTAPNLYAAFLATGVGALRPGGQLVAITPRSYANGAYFRQVRGWVLDRIQIRRIHVFESRKTVFADTGVLQENIILAARRGTKRDPVQLTASVGHEDDIITRIVPADDIVHPNDPHRFIRIPSAEGAGSATSVMQSLSATIDDLGVSVSTGRVVDFRSREQLSNAVGDDAFPMVYSANLRSGSFEHPLSNTKPQWFRCVNLGDEKQLLPAGTYVIVKRFSAKEERRRVVAGVWSDDSRAAAFDNKTNFIHAGGSGIDRDLAVGLSLWLNSTLVDTYFRAFSGHTQVNATDLRSLLYPSASELMTLGRGRHSVTVPPQVTIDALIAELLGLEVAA